MARGWLTVFLPIIEETLGIIMYTPDGYMFAQLSKPDRNPFASGDWFKGTDDDYKKEASSYIAYSGKFHVDEEKQTLICIYKSSHRWKERGVHAASTSIAGRFVRNQRGGLPHRSGLKPALHVYETSSKQRFAN